MHKKFALSVLLLAPILAMMASALLPSTDAPLQTPVANASASGGDVVQESATPAPPPMTPPPPQISSEVSTDAPMLDPVGVDPTPVAVDTITVTPDAPVTETSPPAEGTQDTSNDDRPDNG